MRAARVIVMLASAMAAGAAPRTPVAPVPVATGPDYIGTFEAVVNGKHLDLERQKLEQKAKVFGLGYGGSKEFIQASGDRSSVRFSSKDDLSFVVRVETQARDPQESLAFYRLEISNNVRRLKTGRTTLFGATNKATGDEVAFTASKLGSDFFKLKPVGVLTPGEYLLFVRPVNLALGQSGAQVGYLFGID